MPGTELRRAVPGAMAAGVALGVVYATSPLTVWFAIAMAVVFWWAGRGLDARERRLVWSLLAAAIAVRVLLVFALYLASDHGQIVSFFWDGDGVFMKRRAESMLRVLTGWPIHPADFNTLYDPNYAWSAYFLVLTYLQYLVGPSPYGVHLFNIACFTTAVVAMFRVARFSYGRTPALLALGLLLFLPTLISWSVGALKESLYLLLCVIGVVATVGAVRARGPVWCAAAVALVVLAIAANTSVRAGAWLIMIGGIATGLAAFALLRRAWMLPVALALLLLVARVLWTVPQVQAHAMPQLQLAAMLHAGNVNTAGHHYKLLDERLYFNDIHTMTPDEAVRFVLRAIVSFLVVPLPWDIQSTSELIFLPEQLVWYVLVIFAWPGVAAGFRRDRLLTCLCLCTTIVAGIVVALNNGNVGTLVRFRDTIVPFIVWPSAVGMTATATTMLSRARGMAAAARAGVAVPQTRLS